MKRTHWILLGGAAALGAVLALAGLFLARTGVLSPVSILGQLLRQLSLSGFWGNLAAWAIADLLALLPAAALLALRRKRSFCRADLLVPLACLLLFLALFSAINPTLFSAPLNMTQVWPLAFFMAALSAVVCWLALLLLGALDRGGPERLSAALAALLTGAAALMMLGAAYEGTAGLASLVGQVLNGKGSSSQVLQDMALFGLSQFQADTAGWTLRTALLAGALLLTELAPTALGAAVLLWGADLARTLTAPFGPETEDLCEKTARGCRRVAVWTVGLGLGTNLLQLLVLPYVSSTSFTLRLPLLTLLLCAALFLLCRCFRRGRELQEDSDSII